MAFQLFVLFHCWSKIIIFVDCNYITLSLGSLVSTSPVLWWSPSPSTGSPPSSTRWHTGQTLGGSGGDMMGGFVWILMIWSPTHGPTDTHFKAVGHGRQMMMRHKFLWDNEDVGDTGRRMVDNWGLWPKRKFQGNVGVGLAGRPGLFAAPELRISTEDPPSYAGLQDCAESELWLLVGVYN